MISFPLGVYGEWLYGVTALCKTGAAVLVLPAACGAASTSMAPSCGTPDECSFDISSPNPSGPSPSLASFQKNSRNPRIWNILSWLSTESQPVPIELERGHNL
jgi:hypothetical protein